MRLLVRCIDLWLVKALRGMMTDERNTVNRFFWLTICCVLFACSSPTASRDEQRAVDMATPAPSVAVKATRDIQVQPTAIVEPGAVDVEKSRTLVSIRQPHFRKWLPDGAMQRCLKSN